MKGKEKEMRRKRREEAKKRKNGIEGGREGQLEKDGRIERMEFSGKVKWKAT